MQFKHIVEANGRTIEENNLAAGHKYPLGSLVTVNFDENHGYASFQGQATLYVVGHGRDCDGSPLYNLGTMPIAEPSRYLYNDAANGFNPEYMQWLVLNKFHLDGYGENSLVDTGRKAEVFYHSVDSWTDTLY